MGEQITTAKHLLESVTNIRKKYDEIAKLTGENFNLLRILGKEHYENYHSAIISDLLNEKGSHGQDDLFLKLFIEIIKRKIENNNLKFSINDFTNSTSFTEYNIGELTKGKDVTGGRIDIFVSDKNQKIIIENKIGANDQENQLLRYYNFAELNKPYLLIYLYPKPIELTPQNCNFSEDISNELRLQVISNVLTISYAEEIKEWIEKCIKECAKLPLIRESLNQYIYTINKITDQSNNKIMSDDISKLLIKDDDSLESAKQIKINFDLVCKLKRDEFISNLRYELNQLKLLPPESLKDFDFAYEFVEDSDGFCFCIYVNKNKKRSDYKAETLLSNFKSQFYLNNTNKKYLGDNNPNWFVWINPNKENTGKFNSYSVKEMCELSRSEGDFKEIVERCKELIKDFNKTALDFIAK